MARAGTRARNGVEYWDPSGKGGRASAGPEEEGRGGEERRRREEEKRRGGGQARGVELQLAHLLDLVQGQ